MARRAIPVAREEFTCDGIQYAISVFRTAGAHHASWVCGKCGGSGASSITCATIEEAIARAKVNLSEHHGHEHCVPP
jgi:hypothetical protein